MLTRRTQLLHGLCIAVTRSNPSAVAPICEAMEKLNVSLEDTEEWCPLAITAAERGDEEILQTLLKELKNRKTSGS